MAKGGFREVIDDEQADPEKVTRVVFCSGKLYYDLLEEREKKNIEHTALVRVEQLYPLPEKQLKAIISKYEKARDHIWSQEEPVNMGAWFFMAQYFPEVRLRAVARPASGSPATGSSKFHLVRHRKIVEKSFQECDCPMVKEECRMICIGNHWRSFADNPEKVLEANFMHPLK